MLFINIQQQLTKNLRALVTETTTKKVIKLAKPINAVRHVARKVARKVVQNVNATARGIS